MDAQRRNDAKKTLQQSVALLNKYIIFLAIAAQLSIYFTAARIVRTQNSVGISVVSTLISLGLSLAWFLHGLYNRKLGSCITTSIALIGNIIVLFLIFKYRDPPADDYYFPTIAEREKDASGNIIIKEYHPEVYAGHNSGFVIIKSS